MLLKRKLSENMTMMAILKLVSSFTCAAIAVIDQLKK